MKLSLVYIQTRKPQDVYDLTDIATDMGLYGSTVAMRLKMQSAWGASSTLSCHPLTSIRETLPSVIQS